MNTRDLAEIKRKLQVATEAIQSRKGEPDTDAWRVVLLEQAASLSRARWANVVLLLTTIAAILWAVTR